MVFIYPLGEQKPVLLLRRVSTDQQQTELSVIDIPPVINV